MNHMSQVLVFVLSLWFASQVSAAEEGLVAEYHFDNDAKDSSRNKNDGMANSSVRWERGVSGNALDLNGTDAYVEVPASPSLDLDDATIEAWFYVRKRGGGIGFFTGASWEDARLIIHFHNSTKIRFAISEGTDINKVINIESKSDLPLNKWCHIAVTCDGAEAKIYLNGALETKEPQRIFPATKDVKMTIGKSLGLDIDFLDGMIDEVRIYNRALTAEEIAARAKKYNPEESRGEAYKATTKSEALHGISPGEYALQWLSEPGNGMLVISHSTMPSLYYKNSVVLSEGDFRTAAGLPEPVEKTRILKVSPVVPEFRYLENIDWQDIAVGKIKNDFLRREGVKVLAWGDITSGNADNIRIPVALSIKTGQSKEIVYLPWPTDSSYSCRLASFRAVLEYLKRQDVDIASDIASSVTTKQDNMERSGRVVTSKQEVEQLILPAALCLNGQPILLGVNVSGGPLRMVKLESGGNEVQGGLFSPEGFMAASVGKTFFAAGGQFCSLNNRVYTTTYELVPYAISTIDGEEYHYASGLSLLVGGEGNVYISRPEFWANDELISAFYVDSEKMQREEFTLDKDIVQIKVRPGRYFLVYGAPESAGFSEVAEFHKWFGERIKQRPRPDDSVPVLDSLTVAAQVCNIVWINVL